MSFYVFLSSLEAVFTDLKRGRRERGGNIDVREKRVWVAFHALPDWGLNPQPGFVS